VEEMHASALMPTMQSDIVSPSTIQKGSVEEIEEEIYIKQISSSSSPAQPVVVEGSLQLEAEIKDAVDDEVVARLPASMTYGILLNLTFLIIMTCIFFDGKQTCR